MIQLADRATSDADLVAATRGGDTSAFEVLYQRHWSRVLGVCARRVSHAEAEDTAQEVFVRALHRLDTLSDPDRFGPWVRTIAVRACADALRGRTAITVADLPDVVDITDPTHDEVVVAREDAQRLASGLAALQPRDSRALWLRDALDTPVGDIARDLGMTEASTRVMLARARQRLRAAMGAVAAWVAGIVGIRRQWLSGLLPANPGATAVVAVHAAAAIAAIALVVPLLPDIAPQEQIAVPDTTVMVTSEPVPAATAKVDEPAAGVPTSAPDAEATQPAPTRDVTPAVLEPVVTVERQTMDDPDDDRAAQMGDADGAFLVDVYDGGVVSEVVDAVVPGCLGTC